MKKNNFKKIVGGLVIAGFLAGTVAQASTEQVVSDKCTTTDAIAGATFGVLASSMITTVNASVLAVSLFNPLTAVLAIMGYGLVAENVGEVCKKTE